MASGLQVQRVHPGQLDTYSTPRAAANGASVKLQNMILSAGRARQRGPIDANAGVKLTPTSPVTSPFLVVSPDGTAVLVATTANASKNIASVVPGIGVATLTAATAFLPIAGMAVVDGPAGDPGVFMVDGVAVWYWNGHPDTAPIKLTNSPASSPLSAAAHLQRAFVIDQQGRSLIWTDVGGDTTNVLTAWQDDVSGLTNRIVLDGGTSNIAYRLVRIGRNLAIIRRRSIDLLTGDTPSTFSIRRVVRYSQGAQSMAVCEWDDGAFLLGPNGLHFFDGVSLTTVDTPVHADLRGPAADAIANSTKYSLARDGDYLQVSCGPTFWAALHVPSGTWSYLTAASTDWAATTPQSIVERPTYAAQVYAYDGTNVWVLNSVDGLLDRPAHATELGIDAGSGASKAIPTKWWSKVYDLAAPTNKAQMHRLTVEYDFRTATAVPAGQGLYVSLYDSLGNQLLAPTEMVAGTTRQRATIDVFTETADVQVRIEYANTSPTNVTKLEIHDAWVEYSITRQRA